jgi:hypothetical protein
MRFVGCMNDFVGDVGLVDEGIESTQPEKRER